MLELRKKYDIYTTRELEEELANFLKNDAVLMEEKINVKIILKRSTKKAIEVLLAIPANSRNIIKNKGFFGGNNVESYCLADEFKKSLGYMIIKPDEELESFMVNRERCVVLRLKPAEVLKVLFGEAPEGHIFDLDILQLKGSSSLLKIWEVQKEYNKEDHVNDHIKVQQSNVENINNYFK